MEIKFEDSPFFRTTHELFITVPDTHRINYLRRRQMATFVSRIKRPMENGCARVVRAPRVQSIRALETCRERKPTFDSAFHEPL